MKRAPKDPRPGKDWLTFLRNHKEAIAAMDFFTVEHHLKRLLSEYVGYHHEDRTHLGLAKQTPASRIPCAAWGRIVSRPRLGGLHHRYDRAA